MVMLKTILVGFPLLNYINLEIVCLLKLYLNGASGKDEIIEYLPFEENPQSINPTWKYVYSANNQPDSVRGKLYPGYYQPQKTGLKELWTLLKDEK